MTKYKITEWSGTRTLNYKGTFDLNSFSIPMEFRSFEDGWDYILESFPEDMHEELYVEAV